MRFPNHLTAAALLLSLYLAQSSSVIAGERPGPLENRIEPKHSGFVCRTEVTAQRSIDGFNKIDEGECPYIMGDCDYAELRDAFIPRTSQMVTLRVKFNVFCDDYGNNCALSQQDVDDQMAFAAGPFEDGNILFSYTTEFIDDSTYLYATLSDVSAMKAAYADDPMHQLNIYAVAGNVGGMATFPWEGNALSWSGGIYMEASAFAADKHWLTHEIGHCVGLWHTHQGAVIYDCGESGWLDDYEPCYEYADGSNGDTSGDFCSDTKPTPPNRSCDQPGGVDCEGTPWGMTDIENIMGYSIDEDASGYTECRTEYSGQQWGRTHCWINEELTCWLDNVPGDVNCSGFIDIVDVVYLINYVYHEGDPPCPLPNVGDVDCSDTIDVDDVYFLIDYIFKGGPAPQCCAN